MLKKKTSYTNLLNSNKKNIEQEFFISMDSEEKEENEIFELDINSSSTDMTSRNEVGDGLESSTESDEYPQLDFVIHLPERAFYNRIPGNYDDLYSMFKKKHNNLILKYSS